MKRSVLTILVFTLTLGLHAQPRRILGVTPGSAGLKSTAIQHTEPTAVGDVDGLSNRIDAMGRLLIAAAESRRKGGVDGDGLRGQLPIRLSTVAGTEWVDVFVRLDDAFAPTETGYRERTRAGDISVGRIPVTALRDLALHPAVAYVQTARMNRLLNSSGNQDTGVSLVHAGHELNGPVKGAGVVVGVIDSGIDFTHPDFSSPNGTRIRFLMDMRSDATEVVYTKADIDTNPASVMQRDGNGGGGHGTHVTGTAAGLTGVAQEADIVFVKSIRDDASDGGFSDADIAFGTSWIFERAAALGRPAVVNLSLGGNYGPLDGTSTYEQFLSNLTGPGRIIVAAAGNEGSDPIHAGTNLQPNTLYESVLEPMSSEFNYIEMWYRSGAMRSVAFGYYALVNGNPEFLGMTNAVNVGMAAGITANGDLNPVAIRHNNQTIGFFAVDARNTTDPSNGDGQIQMLLTNNNSSTVDLNDLYWTVLYQSSTNAGGRIDLWTNGAYFYPSIVGLDEVVEIPGDSDFTVGTPATSRKVIPVGSYVTRNSWTDIDGIRRQQWNPNPAGEGPPVVPSVGNISYFSSRGPTRDGRVAPLVAAPGEKVASALSAHLNVRATQQQAFEQGGVYRGDIVQGGGYMVSQGTSMASPHVAGVVALMLQVNPTLDFEQASTILRETARVDVAVGSVPNVSFGHGKVNAHAAVKRALTTSSIDTVDPIADGFALLPNYPNPFNPATVVRYRVTGAHGGTPLRLSVYDMLGREVAVLFDGMQVSGTHAATFDAAHLASGIYVVRLVTETGVRSRTVALVR